MSPHVRSFIALLAWASASACRAEETAPRPVPHVPAPPSATPPTQPIAPGVTRLTPEQASLQLLTALGMDYGYDDGNGNFHSYTTGHLAVSLGGVDPSANVRQRDSSTKVQTVLVARSIAWPVSARLMDQELLLPADSLFTKCSLLEDYPGRDEASKARWSAQIQELYLRLFSRPATAEELALVEETFERVRVRDGDTTSAWLVTLYALTASMEAWNTWR